MSDKNPDVAPEESVVDFPSDDQPEAAQDEAIASDSAAEGREEDGPVSLDDQEDEGDPEGGEDGEGAEEPEVIEFDFGGNKLAVPKGQVPEEVAQQIDKFSKDIWADYTKKSQINAEAAKQLKSKAEALEKIELLGGEALDAFTKGKSIKAEIEQLSAVNMEELWQSNPDQARRLSDRLAAKQAELQSIIHRVDQHESAIVAARQAELERAASEGKQRLDRKYKGFSTEIAPKLESYVVENYGMSKEEAGQWSLSPDVAEMAYKAMLYDQMRAAGKPKATPTAQPTPVKSMKNVGGAQGGGGSTMSFEEVKKAMGLR